MPPSPAIQLRGRGQRSAFAAAAACFMLPLMSTHISGSIAEAVRLFERGELAAAERIAAGLSAREDNADALHLLGLVRLQQNRLEDALALVNRSLVLRPANPHVRVNLARILVLMQRDAEAVEALREAVLVQPGLTDAWHSLGEAQIKTGDLAGAELSLRKALALAPGHIHAKLWLGWCSRIAAATAKRRLCWPKAWPGPGTRR